MKRQFDKHKGAMPSCIIWRDMVKFWKFYEDVVPWRDVLNLLPQLVTHVRALMRDRGVCIFKVGITHDPNHRMFNSGYGYARRDELYSRMDLLVASFPDVCCYFEKALISTFAGSPGFRNTRPGGETPPADGLCYTYVVTELCGDGPLRHGPPLRHTAQ